MRHKKRWTISFLGLVTFALLGAWAIHGGDERSPNVDSAELRYSGDIEIAFTIRSSDGEPLNGVDVTLTESRLATAFGDGDDGEQFVADSHFVVNKRNIYGVHLQFIKQGFYAERWEYVMSERPRDSWDKAHSIEVAIVMTPRPISASLEKFEGALRSDGFSPISILYPTRKSLPNKISANPTLTALPAEDTLFPYLYLDADIGQNGELASAPFKLKRYSAPKPILERGFLRIAGASEGDGFLPVYIAEIPPVFERGFRGLQTAPANGYSDALKLTPVEGREKLFFYCRIGGRFGKGVVSNPPLIIEREGRNIAIAVVDVYLNPTGSTDVSYSHP